MILYLLPYLANLRITLIICIRTIFSKEDLFFHIFGKKFGRVRVWFNKEWHMNNMGDNKGKTCIIGGICNKDYMEINEGIFSPLNWSSYTVKFFLNFWKDNSINTQVYVLVFLLLCVFIDFLTIYLLKFVFISWVFLTVLLTSHNLLSLNSMKCSGLPFKCVERKVGRKAREHKKVQCIAWICAFSFNNWID